MPTHDEIRVFNSLTKMVSKYDMRLYVDAIDQRIVFKVAEKIVYDWTSIINMLYGGRTIFKIVDELYQTLELFDITFFPYGAVNRLNVISLANEFRKIHSTSIEELTIKLDLLGI